MDIKQIPDRIMAADFTLTDLEGNTVKLSDYKGKVVFVNFWATWCPPCKKEIPDLEEANKKLVESGDAVILAVNVTDGSRETESIVREFAANNNMEMHILLDKGGKVASSKAYNITGIPTTYIINKDGSIYNYVEGAISQNAVISLSKKLVR
jgi:cytochrome c-type biogenesis protein